MLILSNRLTTRRNLYPIDRDGPSSSPSQSVSRLARWSDIGNDYFPNSYQEMYGLLIFQRFFWFGEGSDDEGNLSCRWNLYIGEYNLTTCQNQMLRYILKLVFLTVWISTLAQQPASVKNEALQLKKLINFVRIGSSLPKISENVITVAKITLNIAIQ